MLTAFWKCCGFLFVKGEDETEGKAGSDSVMKNESSDKEFTELDCT